MLTRCCAYGSIKALKACDFFLRGTNIIGKTTLSEHHQALDDLESPVMNSLRPFAPKIDWTNFGVATRCAGAPSRGIILAILGLSFAGGARAQDTCSVGGASFQSPSIRHPEHATYPAQLRLNFLYIPHAYSRRLRETLARLSSVAFASPSLWDTAVHYVHRLQL